MANKSSSNRWLKEHFSDPYVKQAQRAGYRSRAVFKLMEMQKADRLFKPGMRVIDLGAAPGGWSQLLSQWIMPNGTVVAVDLLPIEPIKGVEIIQGDFTNAQVQQKLLANPMASRVDWLVSDMAPNLSGIDSIDQPRAAALAEAVLEFAPLALKSGGSVLIKFFQGNEFKALLEHIKREFTTVLIRKPKASRDRSSEIYILARGFKIESNV
jgi:23S rRNA (uridine2552-2'-O)-methyltransferase